MSSPTSHQSFVGFPKLSTEFVDEHRHLAIPWYRLLISLWQKTGGSNTAPSGTVILNLNAVSGLIDVVVAATGQVLGQLNFSNQPGGPAQPQVLGASPFLFTCLTTGLLVVFGAELELSRDNGLNFYSVTLNGGGIQMALGDVARVTWFSSVKPFVTFFPGV